MTGVIPLAPSFDTIGWFAGDIETMIKVGDALLPPAARDAGIQDTVLLADGFENVELEFSEAAAPLLSRLKSGRWREARLGEDILSQALAHFRNLQAAQAWASVGDWIAKNNPAFGAGVAQRFEIASKVTPQQRQAALDFGARIRARLDDLLGDHGVIALPTTPFHAPRLDEREEVLDAKRYRMMRLFILASYCGLPQISLPLKTSGAPLGLSLMGRRGSDWGLLEFARSLIRSEG